jgi:hypothetical protein
VLTFWSKKVNFPPYFDKLSINPAPLFSADALHRLQKVGLTDKKLPAFGLKTATLTSYL